MPNTVTPTKAEPLKHQVVHVKVTDVNFKIDARKHRSGTIFTNRGSTSGTSLFMLPPHRSCAGMTYLFVGIPDRALYVRTTTALNMVTLNSAAATSLGVQGSETNKTGLVLRAICDGTQWIVWGENLGINHVVGFSNP
jgi:hypothetical protein